VEAVLSGRERAREGHAQHASVTLAATFKLNWFAGQVYGIHTESPATAFEVPGAHAVQSAPPLPVKSAVHMQSLMLVAPISGDEPTGQIEHAAGPVTLLNLPAAHGAHAPPFAPVYLALHSHVLLPAGESEFRGHA